MKFKNNFIKLLTLLIISLSVLNLSGNVLATNNFTYEEYKKNVKEGFIDEEVKYKDMLELIEENKKLEKSLIDSKVFDLVYNSSNKKYQYKSARLSLQPGDVIITNATSFFGLTGHAAIALNSSSILEIPGKNRFVRIISPSTFKKNNSSGWIKIYRPKYSNWGKSAASWANKNYRNSKAPYKITFNINSTKETYCSKIVFQAYKFGVGKKVFKTFKAPSIGNVNAYSNNSLIVTPYNLPKFLDIQYKVQW